MSALPVLVMGASGKTGRAVSSALLARGITVRAAVRPGHTRGAPTGTTPVAVDLVSGQGMRAAMEGVQAVYHLAPNMHPHEVVIAAQVAEAAEITHLPRLVFHSVLRPDDARMPHHVRKAVAEALLRSALSDRLTALRPAAYHQNLTSAARSGALLVAYDLDAPFTNVDLDDVAEVAADALTGRHAGETLNLAGPEVLTTREMAQHAESALGTAVLAQRQSIADWSAGPGAELTEQVRSDLTAMFTAYDDGGLVGERGTLADLLGRPATTWATAVQRSQP